jgi:hypothetical protein
VKASVHAFIICVNGSVAAVGPVAYVGGVSSARAASIWPSPAALRSSTELCTSRAVRSCLNTLAASLEAMERALASQEETNRALRQHRRRDVVVAGQADELAVNVNQLGHVPSKRRLRRRPVGPRTAASGSAAAVPATRPATCATRAPQTACNPRPVAAGSAAPPRAPTGANRPRSPVPPPCDGPV